MRRILVAFLLFFIVLTLGGTLWSRSEQSSKEEPEGEITLIKKQVDQLNRRVTALEKRVDELSKPKVRPLTDVVHP